MPYPTDHPLDGSGAARAHPEISQEAARDMLAALEEAREVLGFCVIDGAGCDDARHRSDAIQRIDAALAKARGA
jgi:cytosine/adenosine deaminase-related metal-dependent hydrolase